MGASKQYSHQTDDEQRVYHDRRRRPTSLFNRYMFWGRRRRSRRGSDPQENYYVDRLTPRFACMGALLLGLAIFDGWATLYEVHHMGVAESNPLMALVLALGRDWFAYVKYGLTGVCLFMLLRHQYFSSVESVVWGLIIFYSGVFCLHVYIFGMYWGLW